MFASLVGRMWNHDRLLSRRASIALEETKGSADSTVADFKHDLMKTKNIMEETEENALEEFGDSVMKRLDDHDFRVIEGSVTTRNTTDDLERGISSFEDQIDNLLSAIGDNRKRAQQSRERLDSIAASVSKMGPTVNGFSDLAGAFGNIHERLSETRTEISTIDESVSMIMEAMNITSGGRS
jgi:methyl-accepting chemotaxis protein